MATDLETLESAFSAVASIPKCRICFESNSDLIQPCKCTGSSANVHYECLAQWIESSGSPKCNVCLSDYRGIRMKKQKPSFADWLAKHPEYAGFITVGGIVLPTKVAAGEGEGGGRQKMMQAFKQCVEADPEVAKACPKPEKGQKPNREEMMKRMKECGGAVEKSTKQQCDAAKEIHKKMKEKFANKGS
ncbi:uncharacterized protein B4U80_14906 [Leptotrombidium deliense]|uniref:Uncharacterized protein n=1 Tax=Leptotrombidium deliense TaxID=299467 RepID=A0A443S368_9ACAR|nr:uncharacterized protein B4U80_14906 [Leptotrombidium deliense]